MQTNTVLLQVRVYALYEKNRSLLYIFGVANLLVVIAFIIEVVVIPSMLIQVLLQGPISYTTNVRITFWSCYWHCHGRYISYGVANFDSHTMDSIHHERDNYIYFCHVQGTAEPLVQTPLQGVECVFARNINAT